MFCKEERAALDSYLTAAGSACGYCEEKHSKFHALLAPVKGESDVAAALAEAHRAGAVQAPV